MMNPAKGLALGKTRAGKLWVTVTYGACGGSESLKVTGVYGKVRLFAAFTLSDMVRSRLNRRPIYKRSRTAVIVFFVCRRSAWAFDWGSKRMAEYLMRPAHSIYIIKEGKLHKIKRGPV